MEENFVKGMLYKEIYRNEINSYMVGLFKVKESTFSEFEEGDVINITGTLPRLSDKKEYILYGGLILWQRKKLFLLTQADLILLLSSLG